MIYKENGFLKFQISKVTPLHSKSRKKPEPKVYSEVYSIEYCNVRVGTRGGISGEGRTYYLNPQILTARGDEILPRICFERHRRRCPHLPWPLLPGGKWPQRYGYAVVSHHCRCPFLSTHTEPNQVKWFKHYSTLPMEEGRNAEAMRLLEELVAKIYSSTK